MSPPSLPRRLRIALRRRVRRHPKLLALVRLAKYGPYRGLVDDRSRDALLVRARAEGWRILYLGSGGRRQRGMINLDITWDTGPDVVGDGLCLPFADETFDAIFCESVIEHVPDPEAFLAAASRSLKYGGHWYIEVPFLCPRHADADFQRWTVEGFREALRRTGLEPVSGGAHTGPAFMLFWVLREWLSLSLSLGIRRLFPLLFWGLGFLLSPLLLLDPLLMRLPRSDGLASAFCHVARRPRPARPDREHP